VDETKWQCPAYEASSRNWAFQTRKHCSRAEILFFRATEEQAASWRIYWSERRISACKCAPTIFVRTAAEWKEIVKNNPFRREARDDPSHLVVMFLKKAPATKDVEALQAAIKGPEIVRAEGKQAYIVYPQGIGRSKLTSALIDDRLGSRVTGRNWNTVLNLLSLAQARG
jgi:hypothetical protein